jgi:hypothetical protein
MQPFFIPKLNQEQILPTPKTTNKPTGKKKKNQKQLNTKEG